MLIFTIIISKKIEKIFSVSPVEANRRNSLYPFKNGLKFLYDQRDTIVS